MKAIWDQVTVRQEEEGKPEQLETEQLISKIFTPVTLSPLFLEQLRSK